MNELEIYYDKFRFAKCFQCEGRIKYINHDAREVHLKRLTMVQKKVDALPSVSMLLAQMITQITKRDTEIGLSRHFPIPWIKEIGYKLYNTKANLYAHGKTTEIQPDQVPVSIMTPLNICIDEALRTYHQIRKESQ